MPSCDGCPDKHELGVHTEMFSDGLIDLIEGGVITNRLKTVHPGRTVTSFVAGTRRLYDFVDDNPLVEFHPCDRTNDVAIIRKNDRVTAINSAIEIDLTGQICADSIGHAIYSGIGGQMDFMHGAARSRGGKPIIALPATARAGTVSRIVPASAPGAGVVTTRGHAQLGRHRVRRRQSARADAARARRGPDLDRASGFPRRAEAQPRRHPACSVAGLPRISGRRGGPVTQTSPSAAALPTASARSPYSPPPTILVVDDEDLIRWSLSERLRAEGCTVLEAEDGRRALERVNETSTSPCSTIACRTWTA